MSLVARGGKERFSNVPPRGVSDAADDEVNSAKYISRRILVSRINSFYADNAAATGQSSSWVSLRESGYQITFSDLPTQWSEC